MQELLTTFIESVFQIIQLDFFSYAFIAVIGLSSVCILRYIIWGR